MVQYSAGPLDASFAALSDATRRGVLEQLGRSDASITDLAEAFHMLSKDVDALQPHIRAFVERAVTFSSCPDCGGTRLNEAARSSKIKGINIADACAMQINDLAGWMRGLDEPPVAPLLRTLRHTLDAFVEIGLGYLSLERPSGTLSGGEAQRTKMVGHLGSSLTDVTYVFDEPTIGLHPHDAVARICPSFAVFRSLEA